MELQTEGPPAVVLQKDSPPSPPAEGMDSARDLAEERSAAAAVDGLRHLTQVKGVE